MMMMILSIMRLLSMQHLVLLRLPVVPLLMWCYMSCDMSGRRWIHSACLLWNKYRDMGTMSHGQE